MAATDLAPEELLEMFGEVATPLAAAAAAPEEPMPPPRKKRETSSIDAPDWKVSFAQSVLLRTFCENVGNILTECYFEVVHSEDPDGFSGLSVESIDQGRVCLVQARLSGQVTIGPNAPECACPI
jgi:hypothetical protein